MFAFARRVVFIIGPLVLSSCASTQQMHFAEFSTPDFGVTRIESLEVSTPVNLGEVSGGDYSMVGEFAPYSWHAFVDLGLKHELYEQFVDLPYANPNAVVRNYLSDILKQNNLLSDSKFANKMDVIIKRLKIKSQLTINYNYRACLVELQFTYYDSNGNSVRTSTVEGLAKLPGSSVKILGNEHSRIRVGFTPDDPPICKLAIAKALREKAKH
jgi:hypothetical protein